MNKVAPARFSEEYLGQLPDDVAKFIRGFGLDREFGRAEGWNSALSKKFTDVEGWQVESLVLTYWRMAFEYRHTPGQAYSRFLQGLKDGVILGTRCRGCRRLMVPPRVFCELCFRDVDDWEESAGDGVVATYSVAHVGTDPSVRLVKPMVVAVVWLEDTLNKPTSSKTVMHAAGLLHRLDEVNPEEVRIGMRVKPSWKPAEERVGSILDIRYFKPVGGVR
ncbi:MAG: Zn-ribbon domain-containing OB-fold protein [Candidatus Caldarchaeum sp.]